jgi:short subunit dehydrogenase-like uncharacterized protein
MSGRIILFGATGYTGRLAAAALVRRGARPVLAARTEERVRTLAEELDPAQPLEWATADVDDPMSVRGLVDSGDVLLSTVGPFVRWGQPAVDAAIAAGAHYIDSTGEPPFIRAVYEEYGPRAAAAGCGLLTAFGADWVPGNLAGGLAIAEAGPDVTRIDVGYFVVGADGGDASTGAGDVSGGTRASAVGALLAPGFTFRDGRVVTERGAARVRSFPVRGEERPAFTVGASESFALPRLSARIRDVDVYLGHAGAATRPVSVAAAGGALVLKVPGVKAGAEALLGRLVPGSTGGPDAARRARSGTYVVAVASDAAGTPQGEPVAIVGANAYDFTGEILAWGAIAAAGGGLQGVGALGPVDGFGLAALQDGVASAGLTRA